MNRMKRRDFIKVAAGAAAASVLGFPAIAAAGGKKQLVIVGGGVAGATAARYVRRADSSVEVTLIEPKKFYHTCFMSNEVIGGSRSLDTLRFGYDGLAAQGVTVVHDRVTGIDARGRKVTTSSGQSFSYDRCIVAPGISFADNIEGYDTAAIEKMPHAWQAGPQTALLRKQLEAMPDGGQVLIAPPANPYRCPPAPYERACQIAHYLQNHKPKSSILIVDAKDKFTKQELFIQAWERHYKGMIEWVRAVDTGGGIKRVNAAAGTVSTELDDYKPAVANIIPAQQAGTIARVAGLTDNTGWCPVDGKTFESTLHPGIHVLGDAAIQSPLPKSGFAANSEAKVVAAAVVDLLNDRQPGMPSWINTCYSIVAPQDGISVAMVYQLVEGKIAKVAGAGGLTPMDSSPDERAREVQYAHSWFNNITRDIFG